ncbi:MAG: DUF2336 domain-containing protein [Alphaproteobacteria bacterium]
MANTQPSIRALSTEPNPAFPPVMLTPLDVERLLRDDSADSRVDVLEKISHQYNQQVFASREKEIAEHIFRLLMKDAAIRVRELLAQKIKDNPGVPRDIVLHMANDAERVAVPMLSSSSVLSDADLVSIVEASSDLGKLVAISQRSQVSPRVSDALVGTNYPQVVNSLLANDGASISERSYQKIVEEFRSEPAVMETLAGRSELPIGLVERLANQASSAVAEKLKARYHIPESPQQESKEPSRDELMLRLLEEDVQPGQVIALAAQLAAQNNLTASLVMTALCRGQQVFFTAAMAHFAGVPYENAARLLSDRGDHGFPAIFRKSGLPDSMEDAVHLILKAVQELEGGDALPGSLVYANRLAARILELSVERPVEYLPYFIALIRQNVARH